MKTATGGRGGPRRASGAGIGTGTGARTGTGTATPGGEPLRPHVVDASAVAALLFGEPAGARVASALQGRALAAPTLLPYEVANVCRRKASAGEADEELLLSALSLLERLEVRYVEVPPVEVARLALATGLTAYDAAYLWVARALGAELVTLDAALGRAARRG